MRPKPLVFGMALVLSGCADLQLTPIKTAQQRPSNVAVYFQVSRTLGDPVRGLSARAFRIYEDGQLVSAGESKQTLLNPEIAAAHYTLVLVDMTHASDNEAEALAQAVTSFTEHLDKQERVGVFAFDGSPDLWPIAAFGEPTVKVKRDLSAFKPKETSSNLHGAVVAALDELDDALGKTRQPLRFGTLVLFSAGPDQARRVAAETTLQHVREKPFDVYAIGIGPDQTPDEPRLELRQIGKSGIVIAANKSPLELQKAFDEIAGNIALHTRSYYLLSYCSPARAGRHELKIEATFEDAKTKRAETGSLRSDFDATGFGPGCDPKAPPSFDIATDDPAAIAETREKARGQRMAEERRAEKVFEKRPSARVQTPAPVRAPPPPSETSSAPPADFNP